MSARDDVIAGLSDLMRRLDGAGFYPPAEAAGRLRALVFNHLVDRGAVEPFPVPLAELRERLERLRHLISRDFVHRGQLDGANCRVSILRLTFLLQDLEPDDG